MKGYERISDGYQKDIPWISNRISLGYERILLGYVWIT
jgi:hypothetical protein